MKTAIQYVNNSEGIIQSVQIPLTEWEKLMAKLKKYEQAIKLKKDLTEAFVEVAELRKTKGKKQSLKDFLNEV